MLFIIHCLGSGWSIFRNFTCYYKFDFISQGPKMKALPTAIMSNLNFYLEPEEVTSG